jgi:hypothetical protein
MQFDQLKRREIILLLGGAAVDRIRMPTLVDGTTLTISAPTKASPQAQYSFTRGEDGNPLAPARLELVAPPRVFPQRLRLSL